MCITLFFFCSSSLSVCILQIIINMYFIQKITNLQHNCADYGRDVISNLIERTFKKRSLSLLYASKSYSGVEVENSNFFNLV